MLILAQLQSKMPSDVLQSVLRVRSIDEILAIGCLEDSSAEIILKVLSAHLSKLNIPHQITIYSSTSNPQLLFLNCLDPFPETLVPSLVSILARQEMAPTYRPPLNDYFTGDL